MSKRKKPAARPVEVTTEATALEGVQIEPAPPIDLPKAVSDAAPDDSITRLEGVDPPVETVGEELSLESERTLHDVVGTSDVETTMNVTGDALSLSPQERLTDSTEQLDEDDSAFGRRTELHGTLEALIFASDAPIKPKDLAKLSNAPLKQVTEALVDLTADYNARGIRLEEVAGGWVFRTSPRYAPYVRDLTKQRPVKLSRAQVETLAIIAYRQPVTRPEIDEVRGVDSGPVLKVLLERDLVRILGKREEPGRPLIYGTTNNFLEFFGLKSLKDLPTLREFTELTDESRQKYEDEMGEPPNNAPPPLEREASDDAGEHALESMAASSGAHDGENNASIDEESADDESDDDETDDESDDDESDDESDDDDDETDDDDDETDDDDDETDDDDDDDDDETDDDDDETDDDDDETDDETDDDDDDDDETNETDDDDDD